MYVCLLALLRLASQKRIILMIFISSQWYWSLTYKKWYEFYRNSFIICIYCYFSIMTYECICRLRIFWFLRTGCFYNIARSVIEQSYHPVFITCLCKPKTSKICKIFGLEMIRINCKGCQVLKVNTNYAIEVLPFQVKLPD